MIGTTNETAQDTFERHTNPLTEGVSDCVHRTRSCILSGPYEIIMSDGEGTGPMTRPATLTSVKGATSSRVVWELGKIMLSDIF